MFINGKLSLERVSVTREKGKSLYFSFRENIILSHSIHPIQSN